MKVIGIRPSSFEGNDGKPVNGVNIYVTEKLEKGDGYSAERFFVLLDKLSEWGYSPSVGDLIDVQYNRYGKVGKIIKL